MEIKSAERLESWEIGRLKPYAGNARTHSEGQVEELVASLEEFGWTNPVLAKGDGTIIAGHGRVLAAKRIGMKEVPVLVLDHLSEEQARAYVIADNRLAQNAGWDEELLATEVGSLEAAGFDVSLLGFTEDERRAMEAPPEGEGEGTEDPAGGEQRAEVGEVWLLGRHRVCCGDATKAEDVAKAMGELQPALMVTDPPYGVEYDPDWRNRADRANGKPSGARSVGKVVNDDRSDWREAYGLFPGNVAYIWHPAGALQFEFWESIQAAGFEVRMQMIWAKQHFPIGRGHYHVQHEPCYYAVRKGGKGAAWSGSRKETTLWQIENFTAFKGGEREEEDEQTGHGTQKPLECMARPMRNHGKKGSAVYDPFLGSGTSVIAAEQVGRVCVGLEISPAYVDVIIRRWQNYTGAIATLDGTGEPFDG